MRADLVPEVVYSGRVRRKVWVGLAASMMLALLLPLLILWHTTTVPLRAQACVWPALPRAGANAYLVVALADAADRTAVAGPWAQVRVQRDMTTMAMNEQPTVAQGSSQGNDNAASFAIPLRLEMAGLWRIEVTLQTPGRPAWDSVVQVSVLPSLVGATTLAETDAFPQALRRAPCAAPA